MAVVLTIRLYLTLSPTPFPIAGLPVNGYHTLSWLVEGGGFEPPKAWPTDLQSVPFDRSGTPPNVDSIKRVTEKISTLYSFVTETPFLEPAKGFEPPTN